jgi:membrane-bound lytic murein transglycosylase B
MVFKIIIQPWVLMSKLWRSFSRSFVPLCFVLLVQTQHVYALELSQYPKLQQAIKPLITEGTYSKAELDAIFSAVELRKEVVKKKDNAAEKVLTWGGGYRLGGYKGIFIQPERIQKGAQFWNQYSLELEEAFLEYGVPPEVVSAIIGVETKYGFYKGKHKVVESISTLANRGSKLQLKQLPIFLRLIKKGDLTLDTMGSYAGAMGIPQFISSSYRDFGVDFDNNGQVDLINSYVDAIGSVANYFAKHNWRQGEQIMLRVFPKSSQAAAELDKKVVKSINSRSKPKNTLLGVSPLLESLPQGVLLNTPVGVFKFLDEKDRPEYYLGFHNFYVIMRYNHSYLYARAVHELSQEILALKNTQ